ncbi:CIC11C00000001915 [Sungouiella intermedia]|uniref:CIC11C00000001915 n=1 Tax=Sungouiella intermedia TaxID=45354 RepID=A0A1L0G4H7_9ASCO|nr:CIC11C00000001915 [[Candida] intermedia]
MSSRSTESPSPHRRNSPDSYQLAVKGLEQEKQMVAALKRLSIGHLMNHDPDLPVPEAELHMFDLENHDDSTFSGDSLSLSKTPSPQTSDSNILAQLSLKDSEVPSSYSHSAARRSRLMDQEFVDANSELSQENIDVDLLWVPANLHPEVNPQQFKNHVKSTIDELLERKLSRSKSAKRSKRSSLSLSTTDQDQLTQAINRSKSGKESDFDNSNRFSNPSLRELSTELEALSRMAGMDSNDAVTLARSLSTSSLGYTDVEKLAFDEMNSPNRSSPTSNQAELLDFGVDETSPTSRKSYVMSNQMMGQVPVFQGYPQQSRQRRASPSSRLLSRQPIHESSTRVNPQQYGEDFTLKRSRRLDYRKGPSSTPRQLGSQLQNHKAEKLAELRHNLSGTSLPITGASGDLLSVENSSKSSRLSIQSINPRSSQILFSYKSPSGGSSSRDSLSSSSRESQTASMRKVRDSPYGAASSSSASLENHLHHTKYGHQNPKHTNSASSKGRSHTTYQGEKQRSSRKVSPSTAYPMDSRPLKSSHSSQVPHQSRQRKVSPFNQNAPYPQQAQNIPPAQSYPLQKNAQNAYPSHNVPHQHSRSTHQQMLQVKGQSGVAVVPQTGTRRQHGDEDRGNPFYTSRMGLSKRDKSKELNQNLDLLRNEINEFKESLSKSDPKEGLAKEAQKDVAPVRQAQKERVQETPDFSFDLSSHDVSYEDSLGMEQDVLTELATETEGPGRGATVKTTPRTTSRKTPSSSVYTPEPTVDTKQSPVDITPPTSESNNLHALSTEPEIKTDTELVTDGRDEQRPSLKLMVSLEDLSTDQDLHHEKTEMVKESYQPSHERASGNKVDEVPKTANEPVMTATSRSDASMKKKKSFGSLAAKADSDKKKTGKKSWLWSRDRSVSATSTIEEKTNNGPARSVSSPEINSTKRELPKKDEATGKENVITKLFKKKRSNSVSSEKSSTQISPRNLFSDNVDTSDTTDVASRISAKSNHSKESKETVVDLKSDSRKARQEESSHHSKSDETVTSRIKNKFKQIGKSHEEKAEPLVEDTIPEVEEESPEEAKPQSTLEVQEKLKKTIKRTSKPNQPIQFTDSAFGFPLPPPSHSTLVMIDYRFPVHVERAIYRLSHLKLANPKRSLREQVLLSNFMYAYLNLVDHTLHLEQQMELEENLEQPDNDMDMFTPDEADTEFETDDDLDEGAFDSIKLDLDVQDTQKILV